MRLRHGNMWSIYDTCDIFLITTNSFIKQNGALVMGRGIAQQARDRFKGLDLALGRRIRHLDTYHLLLSERFPQRKLGAFQVKTHFSQMASVELIFGSALVLNTIALKNQDLDIHLNFPGIGNGGLTKEMVYPIIKPLPDNVTIWEYRKLEPELDEMDFDWMEGHPLDFGDS